MTESRPPSSGLAATGISRKTVIRVALVGGLSFTVAILLMAYGPELNQTPAAGPSLFSYSALGHRAFHDFLQESGLSVRIHRSRRLFPGRPDAPVLVAEPEDLEEELRLEEYLAESIRDAAARSAPLIFVLPKWKGELQLGKRKVWTVRVTLKPRDAVEKSLTNTQIPGLGRLSLQRYVSGEGVRYVDVKCESSWGEPLTAACVWPQLLARSTDLKPLVWSRDGILVARWRSRDPATRIYLVSDPDVISNHGLARGDNPLVVLRLLQAELDARALNVDEVVHGFTRERPFLSELMRFPLVLGVAHLTLLLLLVLWAGMGRFGKPSSPPSRIQAGKLALIHNTADLLSFRAKAADSLLRYFDEMVLAVARHYHLSGDLAKKELLDRLQELSDDRGLEIDLREERDQIHLLRSGKRHRAEEVVQRASALHRWRSEMTDGH